MKKIIIRSGLSPVDNFDPSYMIVKNSIGTNVGNLVYAYSVFRTLMTNGTEITPDYYNFNPERADEINEKYDCYVIPLADAFRDSFVPALKKYTKLIKKLKIPVVVIGVGLRAEYEPNLNEGFPFDKDVQEFVTAVLEKSSIIGVRGEITSKYLSNLGFREGIDHTVIGCPSMYAFGENLHIRKNRIEKNSTISVNSSQLSPKNVIDFIYRGMNEYKNYYFIPQLLSEMKMIYTGTSSLGKYSNEYPTSPIHPAYLENRSRFFLNVPTWLSFMRNVDLSVGSRIHGNIVATLANTPSIVIPKDARMRELTDYHNLTSFPMDKINEKTRLSDIIELSDFQKPVKSHSGNFEHFIDFLNKNNLNHIYLSDNRTSIVPLDEKLKSVNLLPPITPISELTIHEMVDRWNRYFPLQEGMVLKRENELREVIKDLKGRL